MALASFAPSGYANLIGSGASQSVILPTSGTPTTALVTNIGSQITFVALGGSSVSVSPSTGLPLTPGQSIPLTIGSNTYLAAATAGGALQISIVVGS
jgi:hypothetical protein